MEKINSNELSLSEPIKKLWRHRYESFVRLYKGRSDAIAEQSDGEYFTVHGTGLTFERFLEQVHLKKTYAIYNKDDAGMVSFGHFDIEIHPHPRDQAWAKLLVSINELKRETALIMQTLFDMGLDRNNMLIEFPTGGFHLLIFLEKAIPAKELKALMSFVLKRSGLALIPFRPRNVEAPLGDLVQLPLRVDPRTTQRSNFVGNLESFDPENYAYEPDFSVLEQVKPIHSEWVQEIMDKHYRELMETY